MSTQQARVPDGVPTGGQWTSGHRSEPDLSHLGGFFESMSGDSDRPASKRRTADAASQTMKTATIRATKDGGLFAASKKFKDVVMPDDAARREADAHFRATYGDGADRIVASLGKVNGFDRDNGPGHPGDRLWSYVSSDLNDHKLANSRHRTPAWIQTHLRLLENDEDIKELEKISRKREWADGDRSFVDEVKSWNEFLSDPDDYADDCGQHMRSFRLDDWDRNNPKHLAAKLRHAGAWLTEHRDMGIRHYVAGLKHHDAA